MTATVGVFALVHGEKMEWEKIQSSVLQCCWIGRGEESKTRGAEVLG